MWVWIIVLLVAAGGLALWMGSRKQEGNDEVASVDTEEPVASETPAPAETSETPETPEVPEVPEASEPSEEPKDEDKPM